MNIRNLKRTIGITFIISMFAIPAFASPANTSDSSSAAISSANKELSNSSPSSTKQLKKDAGVKLETRFFSPKINAEAKTDSIKMISGDTIDFKNTLGLTNENAPELKLTYNDYEFDYIHIHSGGTADLTSSPISFDNKTYNGIVETKTNFDYLGIKRNNTIHSDNKSKLSWNYGLNTFRFDASIKDNVKSDNKNFIAAIPTIGVSASTSLDSRNKLNVYGNITGLPMGIYGHFYDGETGLKYTPTPYISVTAGYRAVDLKVIYNDTSANYKVNGPFAGLEVIF